MKHYQDFPVDTDLYFLSASDSVTQEKMNAYSLNKKNPFPDNMHLIGLPDFLSILDKKGRFKSPPGLQSVTAGDNPG